MENTAFDVIVVGAGPGGTTVASLLADEGKKVLLVDKNDRPGGRMITIQRRGFSYELFPINCVPMHNSRYEELSKKLGKQDKVKLITGDDFGDIGIMYYEDENGKVRQFDMSKSSLDLFKMLGVLYNPVKLFQTLRVFAKFARMTPEEMESLHDISSMDYVESLKPMPKSLYTHLLSVYAEGFYEMSSDKVPAAEMIRVFQQAAKGSGGRFYEGGIGHFFDVMAGAVEENGGKLLAGTRVASINIENGIATGITTEEGQVYSAPVVISDAGIRQTVSKLAGKEYFPSEYFDKVMNLESNLACVGYRYFTDAPVLKHVMFTYFPEGCVETYEDFLKMTRGERKPEHNYIYLGTTSLYPGMAPEGKQVIYACMSCAPDPEIDVQPYLDYVEERVKRIAPELFDHIEERQVMSPAHVVPVGNDSILPGQGGESYGIAMSMGQTGKNRPKGKSPVKGLYFVGNDVEGTGLGTHLAVDSGFKVFDIVRSELD